MNPIALDKNGEEIVVGSPILYGHDFCVVEEIIQHDKSESVFLKVRANSGAVAFCVDKLTESMSI